MTPLSDRAADEHDVEHLSGPRHGRHGTGLIGGAAGSDLAEIHSRRQSQHVVQWCGIGPRAVDVDPDEPARRGVGGDVGDRDGSVAAVTKVEAFGPQRPVVRPTVGRRLGAVRVVGCLHGESRGRGGDWRSVAGQG
jgi:hypothetical protein